MYLQQFVNEMKKNGKTVGIEGCREYWTPTFDSTLGCTQVDTLPLLWVPSGAEVDNKPNFNSYRQIGGWKVPNAKVYGSRAVCGVYVSLVYSP